MEEQQIEEQQTEEPTTPPPDTVKEEDKLQAEGKLFSIFFYNINSLYSTAKAKDAHRNGDFVHGTHIRS